MKIENAIKKLKANGFKVIGENGCYEATKEGEHVKLFGSSKTRFVYQSSDMCAPTYGLTLKSILS